MSAHDPSRNVATMALLVGLGALCAITAVPLQAQGNQRPLSDFINAQGTTMVFTPPAPDQLGWFTGASKTNGAANLTPPRFALVDYAGKEAKYLKDNNNIDLKTTFSGSVSERALADGRALVTVDLQTKNALGWAVQDPTGNFNSDPLVFGARVLDIVAGATPSLGSSHLHAVFTNTSVGALLPDIVVCIQGLSPCPTFELDFISFQASITGILHAPALPDPVSWPEGAPGRLDVAQTGVITPAIQNGFKGPLLDAFPVESIALHRLGQ